METFSLLNKCEQVKVFFTQHHHLHLLKLPMNIKNNSANAKILSIFCLALSFMGATIPLASAESFSIGGTALNTNNQFQLKDGHPVMSTWPLSATIDNDQQFDRLSGNLLKHRSTGKCLNAYQPAAGSIVNVYPCNTTDGDQKFSLVSVGSNINLIQRMGTNFCLDMPNRNSNQRIMLQNCNTDSVNQKFVSNAGSNNPPPTSVRQSQTNINNFVSRFTGVTDIKRLDRTDLTGECVTLVVRYLQEFYGASSFAPGNGGQAAAGISNLFSNIYLPLNDPSEPIPGTIISFPNKTDAGYCQGRLCGHVALVISSQRNGTNLNIKILESNADGRAGSGTKVTQRDIIVDTRSFSSPGFGNEIYWTNPRN
jgi:hypothetical protein